MTQKTSQRVTLLLTGLLICFGFGVWINSANYTTTSEADCKSTSPAPGSINWQSSLESAQHDAQQMGKPIMVEFFAEWCGVCKKMDENTLKADCITREADKWISVRVNVDQSPELARKYHLTGIPTLVFLRSDGSVAGILVGFAAPPKMLDHMKEAYSQAKTPEYAAFGATPK